MRAAIKPDSIVRRHIRTSIPAEIDLCYDCGSCLTECPVNLMTGRLQPRELVRMANFGLLGELVRSPQLWYCLSCSRCSHVCPMAVKPAALIAYLRSEALRSRATTYEIAYRISDVHLQLHRVRRQLAGLCLEGQPVPDLSLEWDRLSESPWVDGEQARPLSASSADSRAFRRAVHDYLGFPTEINTCLTCRECTNACPVSREPTLFDPLRIYRQVTFGLRDELLGSPVIWLCIACGSCSRACSQKVRGHLVIRRLQQCALEQGYVDVDLLRCWQIAQKLAYQRFLERIDLLLN